MSEELRAAADVLRGFRFEVEENVVIEGVSGHKHGFGLLARGHGRAILIDVAQGVFDFLASLAKRLDVHEYEFLLLAREEELREVLPDVIRRRSPVLEKVTVITFNSLDDLRERLQSLLALILRGSGSAPEAKG